MTARPAQWRSMAVDKLVCVYVRNDGLKVLPPRQFFTHSSVDLGMMIRNP